MGKIVQIVFLMCASMMMAVTVVDGAYDILVGANYGLNADNLPPPWKVVQLCEKYNIRRVRLVELDPDTLNAFRGAGIDLSYGIPNDLLTNMATNKSAVGEWFNTYVKPFTQDFKINYILVGDKAIPGLDDSILPVMISLQDLLNANYLGEVKLTTLVGYEAALATRDPPSSGAFHPEVSENLKHILKFLAEEGSALMVSMFPYRKFMYDGGIDLNYALFNVTEPVVRDGGFNYYNLFDEMVDAFYAAIDKEAVGEVAVVVGETGWPTCGNHTAASPAIAAEYNRKFIAHISSGKGTPMKPDTYLEGFIQSIFNEDENPGEDTQCFGMFNVQMIPTYSLFATRT